MPVRSLPCGFTLFKAVIVTIFILTMDQVSVCDVKETDCSDKPTENYRLLQCYLKLNDEFVPSFSLFFWFIVHNITVLLQPKRSH